MLMKLFYDIFKAANEAIVWPGSCQHVWHVFGLTMIGHNEMFSMQTQAHKLIWCWYVYELYQFITHRHIQEVKPA